MGYLSLSKGLLSGTLVFALVCLSFTPAFAQELGMGRELLLFEEIPLVITAAKRELPIIESPSAITVITAEDIKQSGATQLGEALRMVTGTHFGYTISNWMAAGGIRGFNKLPANKVVLLLDGVPWHSETYEVPLVTAFPVALEEIERIEVLRGPGSALYGPGAMFGVINVITKRPEQTKGDLFSFTGGEKGVLISNFITSGAVEDYLNYRFSLGWEQRDSWDYVAWSSDPVSKTLRLGATMDYNINDNSRLKFFAAYTDVKDTYIPFESTGPIDYGDSDFYTTSLTYASGEPDLMLRAFWQRKDLYNSGWVFGQRTHYLKESRSGVQFQHTWQPWEEDILVWGADYTQAGSRGAIVGGKRRHDLTGVFADNTYKLKDNLSLNSGIRQDFHPNTGGTLSHRLSTIYSPDKEHSFRFTWASSYRNPDFIESYYDARADTGETYLGLPVWANVYGQEDNEPEKAETFELGYVGMLTEKLGLVTNIFYTKVSDFIYFIPIYAQMYPYPDPISPDRFILPMPFANIGDARQYGTEVELTYAFTEWLSGKLNYTYLKQQKKHADVEELLLMTPAHMCNAQLRARFDNGISANFSLHYRDSSQWREYQWLGDPRGLTLAGGKAKAYLIANLRLGYDFALAGNDAELALAVFNLFNKRYNDYPLSTTAVCRRITASFRYAF